MHGCNFFVQFFFAVEIRIPRKFWILLIDSKKELVKFDASCPIKLRIHCNKCLNVRRIEILYRIDITKENRKFIYGLYIYNNSLLFD